MFESLSNLIRTILFLPFLIYQVLFERIVKVILNASAAFISFLCTVPIIGGVVTSLCQWVSEWSICKWLAKLKED